MINMRFDGFVGPVCLRDIPNGKCFMKLLGITGVTNSDIYIKEGVCAVSGKYVAQAIGKVRYDVGSDSVQSHAVFNGSCESFSDMIVFPVDVELVVRSVSQ